MSIQDKDSLARTAATQVLSGLYQAIADHAQIDSVLQAMDDFLDSDPSGLEAVEADWKAIFREHFSRVGNFLDADMDEDKESPIVHVDRQIVPSAVIDSRFDIVASNALFTRLAPAKLDSIANTFSTPNDKRRLEHLIQANSDSDAVLISLTLPEMSGPTFVVASRSELLDPSGQTSIFVTLKVAKATWNPDLVPLLETAYSLTNAEIEVLEGLVNSGSIASVSEARGRSVRTVRTQLTHIFGKLGLTSQTELALFLATLTQLMTKEKRPSDVGKNWSSADANEITRCRITVNQRQVAYIKYGDPAGTPVLLIHSTTPPTMTPRFRRACVEAGIFVIAAHKPGSGGYGRRSSKDGPEELAADYAAILDAESLGRAVIAGHCSAGLYAMEFAASYPQQCNGLVLIDTGLPFTGRGELMALPKSLRRTFLPARYIPEILLVPHRIFAANFKRSASGEARVVDYFFQDNPVDQNLTRSDRDYYEITRQIIEYSFEDVERLVWDVRRWASDWTSTLRVTEKIPTVFVHGAENRMFEADKILDFAAQHDNIDTIISEGGGQLQLYQNPENFTSAVLSLVARSGTT